MATQRKAVASTLDDSVVLTPYAPGEDFPLFVQPRDHHLQHDAGAARDWFHAHRSELENLLTEAGALVFRGFAINTTDDFTAWMSGYEAPRYGYAGGSSPRKQLAARVYESTHAAAEDAIQMHQEMAYLPVWPSRVAFWCNVPAVSGGETFVADMRKVTAGLPQEFVEEVERRGIVYNRNFRDRNVSTGIDYLDMIHRSWQDSFNTEDIEKAIADMHEMGFEARRLDDGSLQTAYRNRGLVNHPVTGERLWFNQVATNSMGKEAIGHRLPVYEGYYGETGPRPFLVTYADDTRIAEDFIASLFATISLPC
ncbi:MAG: hypothetical protein EOP21_07240 [Hyphomicrobiales bacterium]|nr:MAG: hypothetical protein EOP21_07240 [Hyphomicrobiales bacterium]